MKNKIMKNELRSIGLILLGCVVLCFCGCKDKVEEDDYDPSRPTVIERFYPETGHARGELFIYGENFGKDVSQIQVKVNDKLAKVIGSNGQCIYCLIPPRAGSGKVSVKVGEGEEQIIEGQDFNYEFHTRVGTLCGFTDKDNKTARVDGNLSVAQFEMPYWLVMDKDNDMYLLESEKSIRKISVKNDTVYTLLKSGTGGISNIHSMCFSPTQDTLYVANQVGNDAAIAVVMLFREDGYTKPKTLSLGRGCDAVAVHPTVGTCFFGNRSNGSVWKYNRTTDQKELLFRIKDQDERFAIQFAPSGDFAYIIVVNHHEIYKCMYDKENDVLQQPVHLCGYRRTDTNNLQWADGVGTSAKFSEPFEGVFDENDNFYLCDRRNHCIRKISKEGKVETFAGRPREFGYSDGELTKALFNRPSGIVYNKETQTFYIADEQNFRIRTITTE